MFGHMTLGSNDLERSKRFYDATFAAWGGPEGTYDPKGRLLYHHNGALFMLTKPLDGEPASHGNGSTVGLIFDSPNTIDAWHSAGVAAGGTSVEDPPGWRPRPTGRIYLAYLRDPDGNKLCALHREEQQ